MVNTVIEKRPAILAKTEEFEVHSREIGEDFLIQVGLPTSYAIGEQDYPVLYALDGNIFCGMVNDTVRLMQLDLLEPGRKELIVVNIGYVKGDLMGVLRNRDLAPKGSLDDSVIQATKAVFPNEEIPADGDARAFLTFIEGHLDPIIRANYRTDGEKAGILGDSMGGLFTLYAFIEQSPLFDKYWVGSPGVLIENDPLIDRLHEVLEKTDFGKQRVYVSLGEGEFHHSFYQPMSVNYAKIVSRFKEQPSRNLEFKSQVFQGHTHASVVPAAMMEALRFLYVPQ